MSTHQNRLRHHALWLAIAWALVALIVYLSLAPTTVSIPGQYGDKYSHVLAYCSVMFWFAQIYEPVRPRIAAAAGLIALGVGIEFVQRWTGYRSFEYADMVADALGVTLGWLISLPRLFNVLRRLEKFA